MAENKNRAKVLLIIMGVLLLSMLVITALTTETVTVLTVCNVIPMLFVAFYAFIAYKKPHGNLLKYAMLVFALADLTADVQSACAELSNFAILFLSMLTTLLVVYCAGRLNRIDENKFLFIICEILFITLSFILVSKTQNGNITEYIKLFGRPVVFATLMIAYFTRFNEHKQAGVDNPRKQ